MISRPHFFVNLGDRHEAEGQSGPHHRRQQRQRPGRGQLYHGTEMYVDGALSLFQG